MAKVLMISLVLIVIMSSLSTAILPSGCLMNTPPPDPEESWFQNVICNANDNTLILHCYVQDVLAGENQTVYEVARANITSNSPTSFGLGLAEPDYYSEEIGRVQGVVTSADLNFVFTTGGFNGSTISVVGRNQITNEQRELAVVGGTGVFRFARRYAITSTYYFDPEIAEYGVLEYTFYASSGSSSSSSSNMGVHAGV